MKQPAHQTSNQLGKGMIYAAWIVLLVILTIAFNGYLKKQNNPNQTVSSRMSKQGTPEIVLQRNRAGHYLADGFINGNRVTFLLDTGATLVSIPEPLADKLHLKKGGRYPVQTANGTIRVYSTTLDSVQLGAIELNQVRASINPHMAGEEILLGMSFMQHLEMIQRGNELILRLPSGVL